MKAWLTRLLAGRETSGSPDPREVIQQATIDLRLVLAQVYANQAELLKMEGELRDQIDRNEAFLKTLDIIRTSRTVREFGDNE